MALQQTFQIAQPSGLQGGQLQLATFSPQDSPQFFSGRLVRAQRAGQFLRGLMSVVHARYHIPAAMLEKILIQSDPVVTCHGNNSQTEALLRFEGLSGCCGAYARVDLLPAALEGEVLGKGTTNVDFSGPLIGALASVAGGQSMGLRVGAQEVSLVAGEREFIEKKVKLPLRWLRSFCESAVVFARQKLFAQVSPILGIRFLRSLPRSAQRQPIFLNPDLSTTARARPGAIPLQGVQRLQVLEPILASAKRLRIFYEELTGTTAWVVEDDDSRFTLALSSQVWRGFSGEGQLLTDLSQGEEVAASMRARLSWQSKLSTHEDKTAVAVLSAQGLLGYDHSQESFFHRDLPFDRQSIESIQPRLRDAKKLVAEKAVTLLSDQEAEVKSGSVHYRVSGDLCNCPWMAKHDLSRGPCKHLLAVQMVRDEQEENG